jgi:very-short-patch-repair endonuclease
LFAESSPTRACMCRYFGTCAMLVNQAVGKYRPDFLIIGESAGTLFRVVVEADGHDFHERTKAQAAHDKKRDRWFQTKGYSVLRFTGSEVFADPEDCASQVCGHVEQVMRSAWERAGRPA